MLIRARTGTENVALVYVAEMKSGKLIEFVESLQPPLPREQKWVLIVSSLYGCPVNCRFCDAGHFYQGKVSREEILEQIDYLVRVRFPTRQIPVRKFKIQFARMGEPAFNPAVLDVLEELPQSYDAPGLLPTVSTIAPAGCEHFFERLTTIKNSLYGPRFQLQFSIHTTDQKIRDWLIPVKKWSFQEIGSFGKGYYVAGDRKITLNFALAENVPVDPSILLNHFPPDRFLIKVTPINPTLRARKHSLVSSIVPDQEHHDLLDALRAEGYEVILSFGELEENYIGSNCGQHIMNYVRSETRLHDGYTYPLQEVRSTS